MPKGCCLPHSEAAVDTINPGSAGVGVGVGGWVGVGGGGNSARIPKIMENRFEDQTDPLVQFTTTYLTGGVGRKREI